MQLEFTSIDDAKAAVFDKQRKIVASLNQATAKIDDAIVKQLALCNAAGTCLERRHNTSLQKDPRFIEWLSRHNQQSLGRLEWLYELRYKLEQHYCAIQKLAMQPVICTVHCGDTQDYTDCAKEVISQIPRHNELAKATNPHQVIDPVEEGICIDVIIGDTDEVHRFVYTDDKGWANVQYIERDDYLIETGNWTKGITDLL